MMELGNKQPLVIAVVGAIASGKNVLADYLVQRHKAMAIEVGTFARWLCRLADNDDLEAQSDVFGRELVGYGSEHIIQRLVSEIIKSDERPDTLVITGVRTPAEAAFLKAHFGSDLLLVYVKVGDQRVRYERAQKRHFATDPEDFPSFVKQDEQMKAENALEATVDWADVTLWNAGTLGAYHRQIETYIVPYLLK
jgi:dephospho-CoA kinase